MARQIRIQFPDASYHAMARGNEQREIFRSDADRYRFLETLDECVGRFAVLVYAYCLMPNHYHLLLSTPEGNLSRAMGWLQATYSIRFNRRHNRHGHLFQGRFKSQIVEGDVYGRQLVKYIHLNPVRPKDHKKPLPVEKKPDLLKYQWSSHRAYLGKVGCPEWLSLDWLEAWGRTIREARAAYEKEIDTVFGSTVVSPFDKARGGLVVGGESLWLKAREFIEQSVGADEQRWALRERVTDRRKTAISLSEEQDDIRLKIWVRARLGGERLVNLARELGYKDGSGVLRVIQRLEAHSQKDEGLAATLAQLSRKMGI